MKAVALELAVLTLGVFLGLQAENWNQDRKERAEARGYIDRLAADFSAIQRQAERAIGELDREIEALSILSGLGKDDAGRSDEQYVESLREIAYYKIPPSRAASYIDILESNNLRLLDDAALVDALIRCDNTIQGLWFSHDIRREIDRDVARPFLDLFLDSEDLSFGEALERTDPASDAFRRALSTKRLIVLSEKEDLGDVLECSTSVVDQLAT